jgi:HEPN domain
MITLYDAFLEEAKRDLQATRILVKEELYSQTLYLLEQTLEKSSKSLYSYYEITRGRTSEKDVYPKLKSFSHDNTKTIPDLYCKILDMDEANIDNLPTTDPNIAPLKPTLKKAIKGLRGSISKINQRTPVDQNNLFHNYASEIDKAYQKYKQIRSFIPQEVPHVLKENKLTGKETSAEPRTFEVFFALSSLLFPYILIKNDIYRYPFLDFDNENLETLNKPEMANACNQLIKMIEEFLITIPAMMRKGIIAYDSPFHKNV